MNVQVKLFATLAGKRPGGGTSGMPFGVDLPERATLRDLTRLLNLPDGDVKICFINGRVQEPDFVLQDGDEIGIFPPVAGG